MSLAASGSGGDAVPTLSVCVFCGSRMGADPAYAELARDFGRMLGSRGWRLVYGGGAVGLMGVVADGTLSAGGQVLGIITQRLLDREVGKSDLTELVVTETMFERKAAMMAAADAFVALPGGFGTFDEILDAVTLRQLGYHQKPVLLLDHAGFWDRWLTLGRHVVEAGFADPSALDLAQVVPDIASGASALEAEAQRLGLVAA